MTRRPGRPRLYDARQQVLLLLPRDLVAAMDAVAPAGRTAYVTRVLRQQPEIAAHLEEVIPVSDAAPSLAYRLGQLLAVLEDIGILADSDYLLIPASPERNLVAPLKRATMGGHQDRLAPILAEIPTYPDHLTPEEESAFWLGCYQQKKSIAN